jgi:hypothetical protein
MSDLSRETRELLARGRLGMPLSRARRARLKEAVLAKIAILSVLGTTSIGTIAAAAVRTVAALAIVGGVGAVGVIVVPTLVSQQPQPSAPSQPVPVHRVRSGEASLPKPATEPSSVGPPNENVADAVVPPRSTASSAAAIQNAAPARPHAPAIRPTLGAVARMLAESAAPPSPLPESAVLPSASSSSRSDEPPPVASTAAPSPPPVLSVPLSALQEESALLRAAHQALRTGDAGFALRLLNEAATRFPHGALLPERAALRVFALCSAGRDQEARTAGNDFLRNNPSGTLASRVRASCGGAGQ